VHVSSNDYPSAFSTPFTLWASAVCGKAAHFRASPGFRNQDGHMAFQPYLLINSNPNGQGFIVNKRIIKCSLHRLLDSTPAYRRFLVTGNAYLPGLFYTFSGCRNTVSGCTCHTGDSPSASSTPLTLRASVVCDKAAHFRASPGAHSRDAHMILRSYEIITSNPKGQGVIVNRWINRWSLHRLLVSTPAYRRFLVTGNA